MIERIKQLIFGTHTDFFELFNALLLIVWGVWLILPFETFKTTKAFTVLDTYTHEVVFGFIPLLIGLYILYTLVTLRIARRRYGILTASAFWIFISIIIGSSNITSTGVPIYAFIAIFSAISYLRQ